MTGDPSLTSGTTTRSYPVKPIMRVAFLAILALWVLTPFTIRSSVGQDAVPYVVAGRFLEHHPSQIYSHWTPDHPHLPTAYSQTYCDLAGYSLNDCAVRAGPYLATPLALPFSWAIRGLSAAQATLVLRFLGALCLAGGMWLLYGLLAHRHRHAPMLLVITAVLLTPMATVAIGFGQTSPVMFASVCLGMGSPKRRLQRILAPVTWVASFAFKMSPVALGLIALQRRRWHFLITSAVMTVVLALGTTFIAPSSVVSGFFRSTSGLARAHQMGSVASLGRELLGSGAPGEILGRALAIGIGVICCVYGMRRTSDEVCWAAGFLALLIVVPKLEWHYLWVAVGAVAIALAAQRDIDGRVLSILPIAAAFTIAPSLVADPTSGHFPLYQVIFLLGATATFIFLTVRADRCRALRPKRGTT